MQILLEPYIYIASIPGKDMRTQILLAFNAWYKVPDSTLAVITDIVNMLHNASLLFVIIFITT